MRICWANKIVAFFRVVLLNLIYFHFSISLLIISNSQLQIKLLVYEHAFCRGPIAKKRSWKNNPEQSVGSQTSLKKDQERWKYKSDRELISIF